MKTAHAPLSAVIPRLPRAGLVIAICVAVIAVGVISNPIRGWSGVLIGSIYVMCLALGGAIFIAINIVGGARWWDPIRDASLAVARAMPVPAVVIPLVLAFGFSTLYPWARPDVMANSHLLHGKAPYLNGPFFAARTLIVLAVWIGMTAALRARVRDLMAGRTAERARAALRTASIFILLFAVTLSVAFWDWTMSLEPEWFSTMYGVYAFSGIYQGGIALVTVLVIYSARKQGRAVPENVLHDLGKLLFGFSMFWAYIWFCQYMLIWYANLPEETSYFATRFSGGWGMLFWLNPIVNFVLPFFVLLSARVKKHPSTMFQVAIIVLAGRWLDVYLLIEPASSASPSVPIYAAAATVAVLLGAIYFVRGRAPQPDYELPRSVSTGQGA